MPDFTIPAPQGNCAPLHAGSTIGRSPASLASDSYSAGLVIHYGGQTQHIPAGTLHDARTVLAMHHWIATYPVPVVLDVGSLPLFSDEDRWFSIRFIAGLCPNARLVIGNESFETLFSAVLQLITRYANPLHCTNAVRGSIEAAALIYPTAIEPACARIVERIHAADLRYRSDTIVGEVRRLAQSLAGQSPDGDAGVLSGSSPLPQGLQTAAPGTVASSCNGLSVLPLELAEDGTIDQALDGAQPINFDEAQFVEELKRQVDAVRRAMAIPRQVNESLADLDPVLRHIVMALTEGCVSSPTDEEARHALAMKPHHYKCAIYGLLDADLRAHLDMALYVSGRSPTAAGDWPYYSSFLKLRRQARAQGKRQGFPTGLASLDDALCGLRGLTFVGGGKGVGKTSFAMSCIIAAIEGDSTTTAILYELDMRKRHIFDRLVCHRAGIRFRELVEQGSDAAIEKKIDDAQAYIHDRIASRLRIIERDFSFIQRHQYSDAPAVRTGLNHHKILEDAEELLNATGAQRLLVVIDMFQKWIIPGDGPTTAAQQDHFRLDCLQQLSQAFARKGIAHAFLVTSEVRKDSNVELSIDDLKGDGRIASDADNVLLIWPTDTGKNPSDDRVPMTLRIAKGRDGVQRCDIPIMFYHPVYRFSCIDPSKTSQASHRPVSRQTSPLPQRHPYGTEPIRIDEDQ